MVIHPADRIIHLLNNPHWINHYPVDSMVYFCTHRFIMWIVLLSFWTTGPSTVLIVQIKLPVVLMLLQWKDVFVEILLELLIGIVDVELLKPVNLVIQIYKQVNFKNYPNTALSKDMLPNNLKLNNSHQSFQIQKCQEHLWRRSCFCPWFSGWSCWWAI